MSANGSQSILSLPTAQNVVSTDELLIVFNAASNSSVSNGSPSVRTITVDNFSNYLGGTLASSYQLNSTLAANIAAYLPTYTGTVNGAIFQTGAGYGTATGGVTANQTIMGIGNTTVNASVNSTSFSGTSNNALYLNGAIASGYQLNSTLNANIAAYLPTYTGTVNGAIFQTGAGYGTATGGHTTNTLIMGIGNTTVNAIINTSSFSINGTLIANSTGANNAFYLGGISAASYVTTSGNYTLAGNNTFAGTNTVISSNLTVSGATVFNKQTNFSPIANLTYGTTINWNVMTAQVATITLSNTSTTMAVPTNLINGGTYILFIIQDSVGSRSIIWNSVFKWSNGIPPILTPTPNGIDIISFISDGTNLYGSPQLNFG